MNLETLHVVFSGGTFVAICLFFWQAGARDAVRARTLAEHGERLDELDPKVEQLVERFHELHGEHKALHGRGGFKHEFTHES